MTSEQLTVTVSPTKAQIAGTFTFRGTEPNRIPEETLTELQIPIWLPEDHTKHPAVPSLAIAGRKPKLWRGPQWVTPGITRGFTGLASPQSGFREWVCRLRLHYGLIETEAPVTLTYTHPLRMLKDGAEFCYVPILRPMYGEKTLGIDTNRFRITVVASPDCSLVVATGHQEHSVEAGSSVTLNPQHLMPIRVQVKRKSNTSVEPTAYAVPTSIVMDSLFRSMSFHSSVHRLWLTSIR